jgi:hypothetical protein
VDNFADRKFFVTSVTWERRPLFKSDQAATMFIETLFGYRARGLFQLYEFVLMPDHPSAPRSQTNACAGALDAIHQGWIFASVHERNGISNGNMGTQFHEPSHS